MRQFRTWLVVGGLMGGLILVASRSGGQPSDPAPPKDPPGSIPVPDANLLKAPAPQNPSALPLDPVAPTPAATPVPPPSTIDQLIQNLTDIRNRKAELEKQEQAVLKNLREKLKAQRELLKKMGVEPEEPITKVPENKADPLGPPVSPAAGDAKQSGKDDLPPLDRAVPQKK